MNTNDTLLVKMIEQDMKSKGVENYLLFDGVLINPKSIELKANEVIYLHYIKVRAELDFTIQLVSGTNTAFYTRRNTNSDGESNLISSHWNNVKLKFSEKEIESFFVRFIKVVTH